MIEEIAERIVKAQTRKPMYFVLGFVLLTAMIVPGIFSLVSHVEPSLEKVLPTDIEEVRTMNYMRSQFGADMMYLVVYAEGPVFDVRDPRVLDFIDVLSARIRSRDYIVDVNNLADVVKDMNGGIIGDSAIEVKEIIRKTPQAQGFVNNDYSITIIRVKSDTGASATTIRQVVGDIEEDIRNVQHINPGVRVDITGFNAIDKATFEVIMSDFGFITIISMILVGIVVFVTFRSFAKGMLPMIVVIVALLWTMGIVGYMGLTITVVSMVAAAMIMGLGIDFGIHVVHNYYSLRKRYDKFNSLNETMKELLRAMVGASLTTIAGFLALLFGVLPAMKALSIILALGILNTLIGAVLLLPVVVYMYDKDIGGRKK